MATSAGCPQPKAIQHEELWAGGVSDVERFNMVLKVFQNEGKNPAFGRGDGDGSERILD